MSSSISAIREYGYQNVYRGVYPIKVNQQRSVVEEILRFGRQYHLGLEAGSKPELLAVVALLDDPEAIIVCNGHKDEEFVELALLSSRIGKKIILVVENLSELPIIMRVVQKTGLRPHLGFRAKLSVKGAGRWAESAGDRSKFGLTAQEMIEGLEILKESGHLDSLQLLHFHIGSQITDIRQIKLALSEAARYYTELVKEGAPMGYMDVGGGLGVDYDGSRTTFRASTNYTLQEYANDVVAAVQQICDEQKVAHPIIVSESGRALTAHHAVLLFEVVDVGRQDSGYEVPAALPDGAPSPVRALHEAYHGVNRKNFQETFHDVTQLREEVAALFNYGHVTLRWRALAERIAWAIYRKIHPFVRELEYVPDELAGLEKDMADTYYCNFSTFQSLPDAWAVDQLFPILPVQRLNEEPRRRATLADITCDSDGKIDRFIDLRDVKEVLELHEISPGDDYVVGAFLVGAYQEILGDLHNLFGDINAVHISVTPEGYKLEHVVEGDTVSEVLRYVEMSPEDLTQRFRKAVEEGVRQGRLSFQESKQLLGLYKSGLDGYTYLES